MLLRLGNHRVNRTNARTLRQQFKSQSSSKKGLQRSNSRMVGILESGGTALKVIEAGAMIALNILSLLGNILVCLSVYRNSSLRTATNLYIIALAVTELIAATLVMPPVAFWGNGLSNTRLFQSVCCVCFTWTMGLTALNRYIGICKSNQQYNLYFSKKKSRILLGSAWTFVALYILIPRLTGLQDFHFVPSYAACLNSHLSNFGKILHYIVVLGLFFVLPLAVTTFSYRNVLKRFGNTMLELRKVFEQTTTRQSPQTKFD